MRARGVFFVIIILSMFFNSQTNLLSTSAQKATIKIGVLGPLAISVGKNMEAGTKLAVKEINAAGGVTVGGSTYELELIVETTSDPTTGLPNASVGVTNVKKLQEQDDVTAMLGLFRKEVVLAVMAELDRPFLGVATTAPIITPYFWRVGPVNGTQMVRSLLDFYNYGLGQQQGVRNVTVVRQDAGWTVAMSNSIKNYLAGGTFGITFNFTDDIVLAEDALFDSVNGSLAPLKNEHQGLNVNALMPIFAGPAGKHITEAWVSLNLTQYLAGINVEAQSDSYFDETQGAAYGEIELETVPPDINSTTKTHLFRAAYKTEYGEEPSFTAFASYDAVYVIKDALERADSTNAAGLQTALATTDFEGAAYNIKFTSEPGSQLDTAADGSKVPVAGAPTGITVHDAYSTATVYKIDDTYIQGYYVQWQQGGVKKTIWTRPGETVATRNLTKHLEWPINHTEHGYDGLAPRIETLPSDITYAEGSTGNNITWQPEEEHPAKYVIYRNGSIIDSGPWNGSAINILVDNLTLGIYNYTLEVNDTSGNWATDTVWVTVIDIIPPTVLIERPFNATYTKLPINISLAGDADSYWYRLAGPSAHENISWTAPVEKDNLNDGTYTLYAYGNDSAGNEAYATVIFTVKKDSEVTTEIVDGISGVNNTIEVSDTITLSIDVWNPTILTIRQVSAGPEAPSSLDSLGIYLNITLADSSALAELWINISFAELPEGQDPTDVRIYYYDETSQTWLLAKETGVDYENEIIWGRTDHLTAFGVMTPHEEEPNITRDDQLLLLMIGGSLILVIGGIFVARYSNLKEQLKQLRRRVREGDDY